MLRNSLTILDRTAALLDLTHSPTCPNNCFSNTLLQRHVFSPSHPIETHAVRLTTNLNMISATPSAIQAVLAMRTHIATSLFSAEAYYHVIEASFFALVIYLAVTRSYKPWTRGASRDDQLTDFQKAAKIAAWKPAPLAAPLSEQQLDSLPLDLEIEQGASTVVKVNGRQSVLNFATTNFLGLLKDKTIEEKCRQTMREYGCGACGPRGFYGTTDVHLECEDKLANFSNTDSAILYSFGAATGSSTIPAFCKRTDIVVCDSALNFTLQSGVSLSRATVHRFKHNDMEDLERILKEITDADASNPSLRNTQRRFIIVEGIYQSLGDLCPLDTVVQLKDKYLFRLILDESFSLGVLGNTGRGALEHFNIPRESVEIATADLGHAVASVGGYCVGNGDVVNHQRLSGAGYCFSASQPPFLATAASAALGIIRERGDALVRQLRENISGFRSSLRMQALKQAGWYVDGDVDSPIQHIRSYDDTLPQATFTDIQQKCLEKGVLVARPVYIDTEINIPKPSIRIAISAAHCRQDIESAAKAIHDTLCGSE